MDLRVETCVAPETTYLCCYTSQVASNIRENIALRQSLTNPYNICIFKNIHNSGKSTCKTIKA